MIVPYVHSSVYVIDVCSISSKEYADIFALFKYYFLLFDFIDLTFYFQFFVISMLTLAISLIRGLYVFHINKQTFSSQFIQYNYQRIFQWRNVTKYIFVKVKNLNIYFVKIFRDLQNLMLTTKEIIDSTF